MNIIFFVRRRIQLKTENSKLINFVCSLGIDKRVLITGERALPRYMGEANQRE